MQTPQDYREYRNDPYLTSCYDAYSYFFAASMPSRNARNSIIFAGTMGLIRRRTLQELGGWPEWCITEDSETSLRILKAGYEGVYVPEAFGQGIMPLTFATFKSQRFRWCFGGIQILRRHVRDLLSLPRRADNRLTLGQRIDYLFGTGLVWFNDLLYLGFTAVLLVTAYLVLTGQGTSFRPLYGALVLLPAALIASGLLRALWSLRHRTGIGVGRALLALLNWLSLSWTVAIAALQALIRSKAVFMRTPKERDDQTVWSAIRDADRNRARPAVVRCRHRHRGVRQRPAVPARALRMAGPGLRVRAHHVLAQRPNRAHTRTRTPSAHRVAPRAGGGPGAALRRRHRRRRGDRRDRGGPVPRR